MGDLPGCGRAAAGGRARVIRPLLPLPIGPCPHELCPLGPLSPLGPRSPLETRCQEACRGGRRGSEPPRDHGEGGRVLERRALRRSRAPSPARLVPRGARPPASFALCWRWRGEEKRGIGPLFGCLGHCLQAAASPAGPALAPRTTTAPVSSWQTWSFLLKL